MSATGSRLALLRSSLSIRLFLILLASILGLYAISVAISTRIRNRVTEELVQSEAYRASDFIKRSLTGSMMANDRPHIYETIELLGRQPGMEVIRIYNKSGQIKFSSVEGEIDSQVDLEAEACYACHAQGEPLRVLPTVERTRIYEKDGDYRVLGLINPIYSTDSCWKAACHAHTREKQVLGVLDVQITMREMDLALRSANRLSYSITLAIILLSGLLVAVIVYRAIHRPAAALLRGTEKLAGGDLDVEIQLKRKDELGQLAGSFNQMARNLRTAYGELRSWSTMLEERVRVKKEKLERMHEQMILVEKSASLGKLAATVAHELNNPLSGILTYARLLERQLERIHPDDPERQEMLKELELIRTESRRCGRIVQDLLTYARESPHELQVHHLHELIEQALNLAAHHMALGEVQKETRFNLADDRIVCDGEQIVQSLLALCINAVEAMPDGGRLTVETDEIIPGESGRIRFSIRDTGSGIPQDVRGRIFDPFFSTKREAKGVGLGLAVVYGIVRRHDGDISVESTPGEGTRFVIDLPREPRAVVSAHGTDTVANGWTE